MKQRVVYSIYSMGDGGPEDAPMEHPQKKMRSLATEQGFVILGAVPQSLGDCWWFWVEYSEPPIWPPYIHAADWLPVGTA